MLGILVHLIVNASLTVSPIGITHHGLSNAQLAAYAPRKLDSKATWTWHPEFNLTYKTKYMQYTAYLLKDSVDQFAGGLMLGPKIDIFQYFSLGAMVGTYVRPTKYYTPSVALKLKGVQIIPMGGITASFKIPIKGPVSLETNILANGILNHAVSGIRIDF